MNNNLFREQHPYPNIPGMPIPDMRLAGFNMQPQMFNPNFPHYLSTMMLADSNAINHRRHTARESTGPLKGWLQEHPRNPYPTKAEKVMLALISGMTLTQVSTWFANARRRLKKENNLKDDEDDRTESSLDHDDVAVYSSPSVIEERKQCESGGVNGKTSGKETELPNKIWRIVDELEKVS